ncbi:DUF2267 domain-containing protein [Inquilinus sp. OTU3971]|uniref:DUF2267 domain-containing protein n=1 Tax=Inquilinus sp. OTU3971 TaxID=3043855 RepID=UPI00313D192E
MSATGLEVFDKTLQTTNIWLNEIGETLGPDRQRCYQALRAVLQTLRDRLSVESAAHVSAQLPMLVRGIFYDGWRARPRWCAARTSSCSGSRRGSTAAGRSMPPTPPAPCSRS